MGHLLVFNGRAPLESSLATAVGPASVSILADCILVDAKWWLFFMVFYVVSLRLTCLTVVRTCWNFARVCWDFHLPKLCHVTNMIALFLRGVVISGTRHWEPTEVFLVTSSEMSLVRIWSECHFIRKVVKKWRDGQADLKIPIICWILMSLPLDALGDFFYFSHFRTVILLIFTKSCTTKDDDYLIFPVFIGFYTPRMMIIPIIIYHL